MLLKHTKTSTNHRRLLASRNGKRPSGTSRGKIGLAVGLCLTAVVGSVLYLNYGPRQQPATMDFRVALILHDSSNGANFTPPAYVGVSGGIWANHTLDTYGPPGYAPLSTRDNSGTIFIQTVTITYSSGAPLLFNMKDFFNIWGQPFNEYCVGLGERGVYCQGWADNSRIRYLDADTNGFWNVTETVVDDANRNGLYDNGETVLAGSTPQNQASLEDDPRILYIDSGHYGFWDVGEAVVYDNNSDGYWEPTEPLISGQLPPNALEGFPVWKSPPFMSDGDNERCLSRPPNLTPAKKEWVILVWSPLGAQYCGLGSFGV